MVRARRFSRRAGHRANSAPRSWRAAPRAPCVRVVAGGTEVWGPAPIQWNAAMVNWLASMLRARNVVQRLKAIAAFRFGNLKPVFTLLLGLTDTLVKLNMGQTAENVAP